MPARFTPAELEAIAALAHLELKPSEVELFARQLGDILTHVEELQQIDTTGIPPTSQVATQHLSDRPDEVQPSLDRNATMANAPDGSAATGLFRVPRVIG